MDEIDAKVHKTTICRSHEDDKRKLSLKSSVRPMVDPQARTVQRTLRDKAIKCYAMNSRRRGICVIISNSKFAKSLHLDDRDPGATRDVERVQETFERLGFEVLEPLVNLTYIDLTYSLLEIAREKVCPDDDTFVMVAMSHGTSGLFYAHDQGFDIRDLWQKFVDKNCPCLAGIPKLFFIQACQGSRAETGAAIPLRKKRTEVDHCGFAGYEFPDNPDILIAHTSVDGSCGFRSPDGSWFIQALCNVLGQYDGDNRDIISLMTIVNNRSATEKESNCPGRPDHHMKKMTPFWFSTLRYPLIFSWSGQPPIQIVSVLPEIQTQCCILS